MNYVISGIDLIILINYLMNQAVINYLMNQAVEKEKDNVYPLGIIAKVSLGLTFYELTLTTIDYKKHYIIDFYRYLNFFSIDLKDTLTTKKKTKDALEWTGFSNAAVLEA